MGKTTVQTVADDLEKLVERQSQLIKFMKSGMIGRRQAYEQMKDIRSQINQLVGRLGSL